MYYHAWLVLSNWANWVNLTKEGSIKARMVTQAMFSFENLTFCLWFSTLIGHTNLYIFCGDITKTLDYWSLNWKTKLIMAVYRTCFGCHTLWVRWLTRHPHPPKIKNSHGELWLHIWIWIVGGKLNPGLGSLVLICYRQKEHIFHWKHESYLKYISCFHNLCVVSPALIWPPFWLYTQETFHHYFVLLANVCWSIWFRFFYIYQHAISEQKRNIEYHREIV